MQDFLGITQISEMEEATNFILNNDFKHSIVDNDIYC